MIKVTQKLTLSTLVLVGLTLIAGMVVSAQEASNPQADPTVVDPKEPTADVDSSEPDSSADAGRCPRCGRQRSQRGPGNAANATGDATGTRGCQCGRGGCRRGRGQDDGSEKAELFNGRGRGRGRGQGRHGGGGKQAEMAAYRTLLENHESIQRTFEEIPGGIRSTTTSSDPEIVTVLRRHVGQMVDLLENGGWIRVWDPLFSEIFEHADKIETSIEEIEGGVAVTEISQDEQVALLIQAHAAKVMEFAARGQEAYDEPTALPEGYDESPSGS